MIKFLSIDDIPSLERNRTTKSVGIYNGRALFRPIIKRTGKTNGREWILFSTLVQFEDGYTCWSQVNPQFLLENINREIKSCQLLVKIKNVQGYIKEVVDIVSISNEKLKVNFPDFYLIDPDLIIK